MKSCLRIVVLLLLVSGTLTQDLDLADALGDLDPVTPKPKKPKSDSDDFGLNLEDAFGPDPTPKPKKPDTNPSGGGGFGLDLEDALGPDLNPKPDKPKPPKSRGGGTELDLEDALGPDVNPKPKPDKPAVNPSGGGGGSISDSDLFDIAGGGGGGGEYEPDGGRPHGGGGGGDSGYDTNGGADQPQEAGSGQIAGIVSAVGVALLGAASSYIAYQKKKLCFRLQGGGADPEMGKGRHGGGRNDNQLFSNLLRTS
ncbi:CD99 molecule isoform 1-T1 [Symphorus nematophorus]